jgi:hypothetical protein
MMTLDRSITHNTTLRQLQRAYARYQMGAFGQPWDHTLSDEEWRRLCAAAGAGTGGGGDRPTE